MFNIDRRLVESPSPWERYWATHTVEEAQQELLEAARKAGEEAGRAQREATEQAILKAITGEVKP